MTWNRFRSIVTVAVAVSWLVIAGRSEELQGVTHTVMDPLIATAVAAAYLAGLWTWRPD